MNREEYYKRLEKTTEKIKTDRCSEDEIENIERQKLYLAEHYISGLEQENKKYKKVIDKVIEYIENGDLLYLASKYSITYRNNVKVVAIWDILNELLDILKEVE